MLVDSHCHLNSPEFSADLTGFLQKMTANQVTHALCVATRPDNVDAVIALAQQQANLFAAVGIHPDERLADFQLTAEWLLAYASEDKVIAIGETGLDYYQQPGEDLSYQHERFSLHLEVAKQVGLPLVVHTREAAAATWQLLHAGEVSRCGAVMHCFTESVAWARKFLDLGCYISISGIVTFKNASQVQEVAKFVPLERLLVETDAPYLAPVPWRGKLNHPALVRHTAEFIAELRQVPLATVASATSANFWRLFTRAEMNVSTAAVVVQGDC